MKLKFNDREYDLVVSSILGTLLIPAAFIAMCCKIIDVTGFLSVSGVGTFLMFWERPKNKVVDNK